MALGGKMELFSIFYGLLWCNFFVASWRFCAKPAGWMAGGRAVCVMLRPDD
jgi:hypothetical protein